MKLSANHYQGGDIQCYKKKDAGMTIKLQEMINHMSPNYPLEMNTIMNGGRDGLGGPRNCSGCMYQWCGGCMNVPQIC